MKGQLGRNNIAQVGGPLISLLIVFVFLTRIEQQLREVRSSMQQVNKCVVH